MTFCLREIHTASYPYMSVLTWRIATQYISTLFLSWKLLIARRSFLNNLCFYVYSPLLSWTKIKKKR